MGTKVPGYERSQERKFPGTFVPRERKFPRTKRPGKERSWERKFLELSFLGNDKVLHRDLSFLGTKGLGYEKSVIHDHSRDIIVQNTTQLNSTQRVVTDAGVNTSLSVSL